MSEQEDGPFTVEGIEAMNRREAIRRGIDPGPRIEYEGEPVTCVKYDVKPLRWADAERPADDRDHCGYVDAEEDVASPFLKPDDEGAWGISPDPIPLYAISGYALDEIADALRMYGKTSVVIDEHGRTTLDPPAGRAMGFISDVRERGVIVEPEPQFIVGASQAELDTARQQRDFLMGQVDSLLQRLAGAHIAAGSFDLRAAQGFTMKETLPINQVLAQIAAANQPEGE